MRFGFPLKWFDSIFSCVCRCKEDARNYLKKGQKNAVSYFLFYCYSLFYVHCIHDRRLFCSKCHQLLCSCTKDVYSCIYKWVLYQINKWEIKQLQEFFSANQICCVHIKLWLSKKCADGHMYQLLRKASGPQQKLLVHTLD